VIVDANVDVVGHATVEVDVHVLVHATVVGLAATS